MGASYYAAVSVREAGAGLWGAAAWDAVDRLAGARTIASRTVLCCASFRATIFWDVLRGSLSKIY